MAYFGNEPAKVAVKVGSGVITATELADDSITTADIIDDAITPNQLDEDGTGFQVGTLGVGAAVSGGHTLLVNGTSTFSGGVNFTGGSAADNTLYKASNNYAYLMGGTAGLVLKGKNSDDANIYLGNSGQYVLFTTNNTERFKVDNSATTVQGELIVNSGIESVKNGSDSATSGSYLRVKTASGDLNVWMWQLGASNTFDLWNYNAGGDNAWEKACRFNTTSLDTYFYGSEITLGNGNASQKNKLTTGDGIYASTNYDPDQYYLAWNYANKGGTESVVSSSRASWIWKGVTATSGNYLELRHRAGNAAAGTQNSVVKFDSARNADFASEVQVTGLFYAKTRLSVNSSAFSNSNCYITMEATGSDDYNADSTHVYLRGYDAVNKFTGIGWNWKDSNDHPPPVWMGVKCLDYGSYTNAEYIIATRDNTGNNNPTRRLTIKPNGKFVLSNISDSTAFDVECTGSNDNYFNFRKTTDGGGNASLNIIGRREASNSDVCAVYFKNIYSGTERMIANIIANTTDSNGQSGYLRFRTSNGGTVSDALVINHDQSCTFKKDVLQEGNHKIGSSNCYIKVNPVASDLMLYAGNSSAGDIQLYGRRNVNIYDIDDSNALRWQVDTATGLVHNTTNFASGTNAYVLQASSNNDNEFIVNGDDRYYMFNTWQTSWSDRKLKKNIKSIDNGLDICDKLNPVTFNWKKEWTEGNAKLSTRKFHGIIAQELQEVVPELVYEGKDKLMVQRDELQWILLSAIKELSAKVKALESA